MRSCRVKQVGATLGRGMRCDSEISLLTLSLLISEDFWAFLSFPRDRSIFSTFVAGYKNIAIAEKREENIEILTN